MLQEKGETRSSPTLWNQEQAPPTWMGGSAPMEIHTPRFPWAGGRGGGALHQGNSGGQVPSKASTFFGTAQF